MDTTVQIILKQGQVEPPITELTSDPADTHLLLYHKNKPENLRRIIRVSTNTHSLYNHQYTWLTTEQQFYDAHGHNLLIYFLSDSCRAEDSSNGTVEGSPQEDHTAGLGAQGGEKEDGGRQRQVQRCQDAATLRRTTGHDCNLNSKLPSFSISLFLNQAEWGLLRRTVTS